jgi:hypothetical protein
VALNVAEKRVAEATLKAKDYLLISEVFLPFLFGLVVIEDPCCHFFQPFLQ